MRLQRVELISRIETSLPSLSGIEKWGTDYILAGDDSPWLFVSDQSFRVIDRIEVSDSAQAVDGRIPKVLKVDYEAMTLVPMGSEHELWIFGSGSRPVVRDSMCRVSREGLVSVYSVGDIYSMIRSRTGISEADFNIEAAQSVDGNVYLFNRGTPDVFVLRVAEVIAFLENGTVPETLDRHTVVMPDLNGSVAGFSGACWSEAWNVILFSASVEHTSNWIDDGEVAGSLVGTWSPKSGELICFPVTGKEGLLPLKIESICIQQEWNDSLRVLAVTDSDGGISEILRLDMHRY